MSNAASQASDLYESTVKNEAVFTFQDDDGYLVFHIRGIEAVPFWSCCERCERVQTQHPKYLNWSIVTESLQEFMNETLALFEYGKAQVLLGKLEEGLDSLDTVLQTATEEDPKDFEFIVDIESRMAAVMRTLGRTKEADEVERRLASVRDAMIEDTNNEDERA